MSKPLLTPKPKRRDRRAGVRSEHVERIRRDSSKWRSDADRPVRSDAERHRSYGRLLARYDHDAGPWTFRLVLAFVLLALGVLIGRTASASADLARLESAPSEYARLVELAASACEAEGTCAFGWRSAVEPPAEMRRLMPRVRAREIHHDTVLARTTFRGAYSAEFQLQYHHRATTRQADAREALARRHREAESWWTPPPTADLGGGWVRIASR